MPLACREIDLSKVRLEVFWSRVDVRGPEDCWEWKALLTTHGYGRFSSERRYLLAPRIAYAHKKGPVVGLYVLHKCDNRKCVNPEHLFLGDCGDNLRDMVAKGRSAMQQHPERSHFSGPNNPQKVNPRKGVQVWNARLNEFDVQWMRVLRKLGLPFTVLGRMYEISAVMAQNICTRKAWRHVEDIHVPERYLAI